MPKTSTCTSRNSTGPAAHRTGQRTGRRPAPRAQKPDSPPMQQHSYLHVPCLPDDPSSGVKELMKETHPICDDMIKDADECYQNLEAKFAQQKQVSDEQIKKLRVLVTQAREDKQRVSGEAWKWKNEAIKLQKRLDEMSRDTQDNVTREQHSQVLNDLYTLASSVTNAIFLRMTEKELLVGSELTSLPPALSGCAANGMPWSPPEEQSEISINPASLENAEPMLSMLHSPSPLSLGPRFTTH